MINYTYIKDSFEGLVGFNPADMSNRTFELADRLHTSLSGVYFQDVHPLITQAIIESIFPNHSIRYPEAELGKKYTAGEVIVYDNKIYRCLIDTEFNGIIESIWEQTNTLSLWLEQKVQATYTKVVQSAFADVALSNKAKDLLTNSKVYTSRANISNVLPNNNNLVGFIIEPTQQKNISLRINQISLQADRPGINKLYLFHTTQEDPVNIYDVNRIANTPSYVQIKEPIVLSDYTFDKDGYWIIAYVQDEAQAIINNTPIITQCSACTRNKKLAELLNYVQLTPFETDATLFTEDLWDQNENIYTENTNYGLNLDLSVVCDYTPLFIEHKQSLVRVIQLQFAVDTLREYVYNPSGRTNRTAALAARADVLYALDGEQSKFSRKSGLSHDLQQAYEALNISFQGVNSICIPCNKTGIRYKAIAR